jgi:predicted membrane-bound mannosyltransferase
MRRRHSSPYSFLAIYFIFIIAIYSLIPYKTPWLALNLWLPLALFAGRAVELAWNATAKQLNPRAALPLFGVSAAIVAALIAHDTRQRVFLHPAGETNPYAYAHTTEDILGLPTEISELAQRDGIANPRIAVIATDPWPLPWYLRHFSQVGFWQPGQQPGKADFYITSTDAAEQYQSQLTDFRADFFGERPGVLILLWLPAPK